MHFKTILLTKKDGVSTITFNRPDVLNAFNYQMSAELKEAVSDIAEDASIKVVVITGAGSAFMAGADINMIQEWTDLHERGGNVKEIFENSFSPTMLEKLPQPVIAAVNGYAFGMGCEIVLGCDLCIASENAQFGQLEIKLGIMTGDGGSVRLTRLVGKLKAMEMVLTGDRINAQEAYRIGLANQVVPPVKLLEAVGILTDKLRSKSAVALKSSKASVNKSADLCLSDALEYELSMFCEVIGTEDAREGLSAFLEKRRPEFKDK